MRDESLILSFPDYLSPAQRLADALDRPCATVSLHRFPDGESKLRLPAELPPHVVLCRTLDWPNDKLVELMLCARAARAAGVKHLTLVAPYLCYMRQDAAFHPGEIVSQRIVGEFLAGLFDTVITVDPHLHRVHHLHEAVPARRTVSLSAGGLLAEFLRERLERPLLVGPDRESRQWVAHIAKEGGFDWIIAHKNRLSDRAVEITLPDESVQGRTVVIVDDVASTGRTVATAATVVKDRGAAAIHCAVTHALFVDDAQEQLRAAGVEEIWSSTSLLHPTNAVDLTDLLASAVLSD
ncbi:MAG TPA: ribose-phosphate diphosphokinase [Gammaproteobacteria bacterium]|nr:ribose-phosphate diphosphokinase [Gammaproteobacteria bacterium]